MTDVPTKRKELLASCLEAARVEILRRLRERKLPTSVELQQAVVKDNEERTGWSSAWETVRVSSLCLTEIQAQVRDESVQFRLIGLRDQLQPLAEFLDQNTELGAKRSQGLLPDATGPDAILARFLTTLAHVYLAGLSDVARRSTRAIDRIDAELTQLCDTATQTHRKQLALAGLRINRRLQLYRGVSLRPLSDSERGEALLSTLYEQLVYSTGVRVPDVLRVDGLDRTAPETIVEAVIRAV